MGICRIQKPSGATSKHGKVFAQITCNGAEGDEYDFDALKGDLHLNLICEEEEGSAFYIGNIDEALKEIKEKINVLMIEQEKIKEKIDLKEFEDYIKSNPIEV